MIVDIVEATHRNTVGEIPSEHELCSVVMNLELRHLRAVVAVADHGSFTTAAVQLGVSQPALTRTVQQAERILQTQLFDRTSRRVELAESATDFVTAAKRMLFDLEQAVASLTARRALRLGFSWLLPDSWAHATVAGFERATGVTVDIARFDDPLRALREGQVDVAVVRRRGRGSSITYRALYTEARVAAVSASSELATREQLTWHELRELPLVVNTLTGTTVPRSWRGADRAENRKVVECTNFDEWLELIAADRGVGAVPEIAARRVNHSHVRFIPIPDAPPTMLQLAYLTATPNATIDAFVDAALRAVNREARPRDGGDVHA